FNGGYEFLTDSTRTERDGRYEVALGASYPIGAPKFTRATLVGDVFADQPAARGESTIVGIEAGLRYQLTPSIVWDVGLGTPLAGGAAAAPAGGGRARAGPARARRAGPSSSLRAPAAPPPSDLRLASVAAPWAGGGARRPRPTGGRTPTV